MAPLFPDEAKPLKLDRPRIRRAERMASIAEAQLALHYCGQVVFDRTRLNRHKKLAAAVLGYIRRPRILVARLLQEIDAGRGRRYELVGKAEAVSCAPGTVFELAHVPQALAAAEVSVESNKPGEGPNITVAQLMGTWKGMQCQSPQGSSVSRRRQFVKTETNWKIIVHVFGDKTCRPETLLFSVDFGGSSKASLIITTRRIIAPNELLDPDGRELIQYSQHITP